MVRVCTTGRVAKARSSLCSSQQPSLLPASDVASAYPARDVTDTLTMKRWERNSSTSTEGSWALFKYLISSPTISFIS